MRILIGSPLKCPPKQEMVADSLVPDFPSMDADSISPSKKYSLGSFGEGKGVHTEGLDSFSIFCTSDFITVTKEVYVRTRRVRLFGLEGAGKTSLHNAILRHDKSATAVDFETMHSDWDTLEEMAGGLCYIDSTGVNLQFCTSKSMHHIVFKR